MTRWLAAPPALLVVALPVLVLPSRLVVGLGAAAAALCAAGVLGRSVRLVTAGTACALVQLTLALWLSAAPVSVVTSIALGVALVLLLEIVDFLRRVHGVEIDPAVLRGQIGYWVERAGANVAVMLLVYLAAQALSLGLPVPAAAALATAGALGSLVGVVRALWHEEA